MDTSKREIIIFRIIDAPRSKIWEALTDPDHLIKWWGPDGFTNTFEEINIQPGGVWRFVMHGSDGTDYPNFIVFKEIRQPESISFWHGEKEGDPNAFETKITLEDKDSQTKVTLHSIFPTEEAARTAVETYGAIEGANQTLGRLDAYIELMG